MNGTLDCVFEFGEFKAIELLEMKLDRSVLVNFLFKQLVASLPLKRVLVGMHQSEEIPLFS